MNRFTITTVLLGLLPACLAPSLRADDRSKETHFTITQPLQVQGVLLAPGQYVFKLAEADTDHRVVSIDDASGRRLGVVIGVSAYRANAGDKNRFVFSQPQGSQPSTLKSWFYPGDNFGIEFPAEKLTKEARGLAKSKGTGQPAATASDTSSARD
jgi:hypothetical protein